MNSLLSLQYQCLFIMDVLYRNIFSVIWFFIRRPWSSLYIEEITKKKKSLGNNPLKINIDNSGEWKETQMKNKEQQWQ